MNIIECIDLSKKYSSFFSKPSLALNQFSASIKKGKITALLGANGAGKSTLMRLIAAIEYPSSGEIKVNGFSVIKESLEIKKELGYMNELSAFYSDMSVKSFLMLGKKLRSLPQENIDWAIEITSLEEVLDKKIQNLSKGFRQRLSLANAIIHKPAILILDEPSSGLDPAQSISFKQTIKNLNCTRLFSSHSTSEIEAIAQDILVLDKGRLLYSGSVEDFLQMSKEKNLEKTYIALLEKEREKML